MQRILDDRYVEPEQFHPKIRYIFINTSPFFNVLDPLNIKSRTFIQRRTETYEKSDEKEIFDPELKAKDKQIDEQIKEYNEVYRQKTLQEIYEEEHMDKKKDRTTSDYQERIFDWERDMNSTVRQMSSKSAKDLVSKSTLNDRFGSSSSKKYL